MPKSPGFLGYTTLIGNQPSKWEQTKQALWDSNLNAPVRGFYNLMNTPLEVLLGDTGAEGQQAVADSMDAAGGMMMGGSVVPKPANAVNMGIRLWHGSPREGLTELLPSPEGTGALGPGVYGSPFDRTAQNYGPNVYEFEAPDDVFLGSGKQWDEIPSNVNSYQVWRDQVTRLADANPEHADTIRSAGERMLYDGYPFFRELAYRTGSKEKAQELYKRAGFKGLSAMVDGPEMVLFDRVPLSKEPTR